MRARAAPALRRGAALLRPHAQPASAAQQRLHLLYDELLASALPGDAKCVFEHLRQASKQRHLPAFERCAGAI